MARWEPYQVNFTIIIVTVSICFLSWIGVSLYKFARTAPKKEVPKTVVEQAIEACIYRGGTTGVPILEKKDGEERLIRCEKKDN